MDSMWIPHRMHGRVKAAPLPHILHGFTWNPCGIHAESMESLWTPGSPVPRNFRAFRGICMESVRIPHGFLVHFWQGTLPFFYPLECLESTRNPWKFRTDSTDSGRNEWGRVKSSRNGGDMIKRICGDLALPSNHRSRWDQVRAVPNS